MLGPEVVLTNPNTEIIHKTFFSILTLCHVFDLGGLTLSRLAQNRLALNRLTLCQ